MALVLLSFDCGMGVDTSSKQCASSSVPALAALQYKID